MKRKYYMRGLGVGILATSMLFLIAMTVMGYPMNDDDIRRKAAALGMVEASDTSKTLPSFVIQMTVRNVILVQKLPHISFCPIYDWVQHLPCPHLTVIEHLFCRFVRVVVCHLV